MPTKDELIELPPLPSTWVYSYLENLGEVVRGASPRPAGSPKYFGRNIPWITVAELTKDDNVYLERVSSVVTEEGKKNSRFIEKGTLMLTNSGATLGVPKITKIDGCFNDGSVAILSIPLMSQLYIYYFLKGQTESLRKINQGAAQPNLNTTIVKKIMVPIPPVKEQREIVRRVDELFNVADKVEERYKKAKTQVDNLQQSILAKAFRGELVPQNPNDEPAKVLLERIKRQKTVKS